MNTDITLSHKLINIIVPCYNVEAYLDDCLSSIFSQGCAEGDLDVIAINDGSTDGTGEILKKWQANFANLKVVEQSNQGVSRARNQGLDLCHADYVWFVDADDYLVPGCLTLICERLKEEAPDIVRVNYKSVPAEGGYQAEQPLSRLTIKREASNSPGNGAASTIYGTEFLSARGRVRFQEEMKYGEDTYFNYQVFLRLPGRDGGKLVIEEPVYCYRHHSTSAMHNPSQEARNRHVRDLLLMGYLYKKNLETYTFDKQHKRANTQLRQHAAVQGGLSILPYSSLNARKVLSELKKEGLYPFAFYTWSLANKELKGKVVEMIKLMTRFEPFFWLYYYGIKLLKRSN